MHNDRLSICPHLDAKLGGINTLTLTPKATVYKLLHINRNKNCRAFAFATVLQQNGKPCLQKVFVMSMKTLGNVFRKTLLCDIVSKSVIYNNARQ